MKLTDQLDYQTTETKLDGYIMVSNAFSYMHNFHCILHSYLLFQLMAYNTTMKWGLLQLL